MSEHEMLQLLEQCNIECAAASEWHQASFKSQRERTAFVAGYKEAWLKAIVSAQKHLRRKEAKQ